MFDGVLHHLQVTAFAETGIDTGQDDATDLGVGVEGLQGAPQLTHQRGGKDVQPVGFVERYHCPVAR
jgi:hypothetical protein